MILDQVPTARLRQLTNANYFLPNPSSTFHGRDIFAPVAAALAEGVSPEEFGPVIQDPVRFEMRRYELRQMVLWLGRIMHIDHFGNCVTNLPWEPVVPDIGQASLLLAGQRF